MFFLGGGGEQPYGQQSILSQGKERKMVTGELAVSLADVI